MRPESAPRHIRQRSWARQTRLRSLGFANYNAYLNSGTWRAVKARYRASGRPQACECGETDVQLHHITYDRVGGTELDADLIPLCNTCHHLVHALERRQEIGLDLQGLHDPARAAAHHAALDAQERERQLKREQFHALPLHERIARLERANTENSGPIYKQLKQIRIQLERAERKAAMAGSGAVHATPGMDRRLREYEQQLTSDKPDALNDLAA